MNNSSRILNPMVFVRDETDPAFRAHMIRRAQEAADSRNRLSLEELKNRLSKYQDSATINA